MKFLVGRPRSPCRERLPGDARVRDTLAIASRCLMKPSAARPSCRACRAGSMELITSKSSPPFFGYSGVTLPSLGYPYTGGWRQERRIAEPAGRESWRRGPR